MQQNTNYFIKCIIIIHLHDTQLIYINVVYDISKTKKKKNCTQTSISYQGDMSDISKCCMCCIKAQKILNVLCWLQSFWLNNNLIHKSFLICIFNHSVVLKLWLYALTISSIKITS